MIARNRREGTRIIMSRIPPSPGCPSPGPTPLLGPFRRVDGDDTRTCKPDCVEASNYRLFTAPASDRIPTSRLSRPRESGTRTVCFSHWHWPHWPGGHGPGPGQPGQAAQAPSFGPLAASLLLATHFILIGNLSLCASLRISEQAASLPTT